MELDGKRQLRNVFWAVRRSITAYESFRDTVTDSQVATRGGGGDGAENVDRVSKF